MPIVKKNEVMPVQPIVLVVYGQPGCGKTSLACTAENPLLIDCERGAQRAISRCDTLVASKWQDVMAEYATMKQYKTIVVDTAKACLDELLSNYAIEQNYKLRTNSLKRYGQMGEDFQLFVNELRNSGCDLIFICHDKETTEGDVVKHSPNCTGQSKDLLIRMADQVGYMSIVNKRRTISFEPSDNFLGKNVAQLALTEIPDSIDPAYPTFMADIITKVKDSINNRTEAQQKANEKLSQLRELLAEASTEEQITQLLTESKELPSVMKTPFFLEMCNNLATKGYVFDKVKKNFVKKTDDSAA